MQNKAQDDDLVMSLVELALARPSEQREAYLQDACAGDSQLFSEVWNYVQSEQRMQGFLLDPLYPPASSEHPFEPGELLHGRFRIVREVAQGGMGVVYEAVDEKLERRIALKCAKAGFRKRLPPEVRNASEISHPNVCKIFEIHTASTRQGEIDFLTMEFLDGKTLADRLLTGPLPEEEARAIALQLCAGLAEAHRNNVIHGDLKSTNVILTTGIDGAVRAVITDFGLARNPEATHGTAQSGALGGTPDYMAPELWKGQKASIASDIYALGVILYELISRRRPYTADEPPEERLIRKPAPVHPKWDRTLARCLDPDPARRFRDADEVAQALAPRSRKWFLAAAAGVALAVVSGVVTYQRATGPAESVRLAVLPFVSDNDTASLADGVLRDTASQFALLKGNAHTKLTFVPLTKTLRNHVTTTDQARSALGATHTLLGSLEKQGENVTLHVFLTDARSGVNAKEWKAVYRTGEVKYVGVALAGIVTETLHLPPLLTTATVNANARPDYLTGLSYVSHSVRADESVALLERAVAADPESPQVYAGLAEACWFKFGLTKDQIWVERTAESVRQAELRDLDLTEVHLISGLLKANSGLYEQAAADYLRAIELQPGNGDAHRRLGLMYQRNSQLSEALAEFRKAVELQPDNLKNYQNLGAFYMNRDEYREAVPQFENMVRLEPGMSDAHFTLGSAYRELGRFTESEKELRTAIRLKDTAIAEHALGFTLVYQGKYRDAISCYLRALAIGPESALLWLNLGVARSLVHRDGDAREAFRHGLDVAQENIKDPRNGDERARLAYLCARLGDRRRAESEVSQALRLRPDDADTRWMAVLTYEALGRREDTMGLLARSPSGMLAQLNRYPDLAGLRRDPRFLQLLSSTYTQ